MAVGDTLASFFDEGRVEPAVTDQGSECAGQVCAIIGGQVVAEALVVDAGGFMPEDAQIEPAAEQVNIDLLTCDAVTLRQAQDLGRWYQHFACQGAQVVHVDIFADVPGGNEHSL